MFRLKNIMRALSLKQPFAELVVCGRKTVELRKWNTNFRGEFFVHASGNTEVDRCKVFGFNPDELPKQCLVGKAQLVRVVKYGTQEELGEDAAKHLAGDFYTTFPLY